MSDLYYPKKIIPQTAFLIVKNNTLSLSTYFVDISGEEYLICDNFANNMWSSSKKGHWGRGLINSKDDTHKAERTGILGEMAFAKCFGLGLDIEYRKGGKAIDFLSCNNQKIEIKTAAKRPKYDAGLVKCLKNLKADIYVFGYIEKDDKDNHIANITLIGFDYKENIIKQKKNKAKVGNHLNYELKYEKLIPIECMQGLLNV